MYLLDTNTLIYYFKGKGQVAARLLQVPPREVALSSITVYELEVGLAKSSAAKQRRAQLRDFLASYQCFRSGGKRLPLRLPYAQALNGVGFPLVR